jgi:hypothetical protein
MSGGAADREPVRVDECGDMVVQVGHPEMAWDVPRARLASMMAWTHPARS